MIFDEEDLEFFLGMKKIDKYNKNEEDNKNEFYDFFCFFIE